MVFKVRRKSAALSAGSAPSAEILDAVDFGRAPPASAPQLTEPEPVYVPEPGAAPVETYSAFHGEDAAPVRVAQPYEPSPVYAPDDVVAPLPGQSTVAYGGFGDIIDMPHPHDSVLDAEPAGQFSRDQDTAPPNPIEDASDLYAAEAVEFTQPAKRKGLFGLKRQDPAVNAVAKRSAAAKPKATKARKSAPAPRSVFLQIAMRDLHGTYLEVSDTSVVPVEGAVAQAIRVSELDHHLALPGKRSHRAAMDHGVATIGAQATILFPADKSDATFFAAPLDEIQAVEHPCSPVHALVVDLLRGRFPEKVGCVAALSLTDEGSGATTLILFHRADTGLVRDPYVVLRSDDLQMDLNSFYENRQVPLADRDRLAVFTNGELLSAAGGLQPYPRDRTFGGVTAGSLLGLVSAAGLAVTIMSAGYAATVYLTWQQADSALRAEKAKGAKLSTDLSRLIEGSVQSYAKLANLNVVPSLDLLERLHSPGSVGSMKIDRASGSVLEYTLALNKAGASGNATSNSLTSADTIAAFKAKPAPEGCAKAALALTEGGNVLKASFICQVDSGNFGRHRLD